MAKKVAVLMYQKLQLIRELLDLPQKEWEMVGPQIWRSNEGYIKLEYEQKWGGWDLLETTNEFGDTHSLIGNNGDGGRRYPLAEMTRFLDGIIFAIERFGINGNSATPKVARNEGSKPERFSESYHEYNPGDDFSN